MSLRCPLLSLETPKDVRSVANQLLNIQATSKGYNQTARMRRLIWAFAGRTYHIVGKLMSQLRLFIILQIYCLSYSDIQKQIVLSIEQTSPSAMVLCWKLT